MIALNTRAVASVMRSRRQQIVSAWFENQFDQRILKAFPNDHAQSAVADRSRVEAGYIRPLLDLLIEYAQTGNRLYRDLYISERRRYAPHRAGVDVLRTFFSEVLPRDEQAVLSALGGDLADACARWLGEIHSPLIVPVAGSRLQLLTIGDCLLSEIQSFLLPRFLEEGTDLDVRYYYFSALMGADIARDGIAGTIRANNIDAIAASYLSYEGIPLYRSLLESADRSSETENQTVIAGIIQFMRSHLEQMRALTDAPILLHNACGLPLSRIRRLLPALPALSKGRRSALAMLNAAISELADATSNCFVIDETTIVRKHGVRACATDVLPRRIGRDADFHPAVLGQHLAEEYHNVLRDVVTLKKAKVLLVDFDNTLWDGVMADGRVLHHRARQELLKQLMAQGMLLAAVSKNDPANIRWDEMALAPDDFVRLKINWNLKVQSIRELASELNLGLDSFVLIDDNPAERALVEQELPGVVVLDAMQEATWLSLKRLFRMPNTRDTEEARARTQMYREQAERAEATAQAADYPALMRSLGLKARIGLASRSDIDRITELVQRTNQFNTTTIRYPRGEIEARVNAANGQIWVADLSDKFGNLGTVCVAVVKQDGDESVIEDFVMSCRAMGFGLEYVMLERLAAAQNARRIVGKFVPSNRNEPASGFYFGAGCTEESVGTWVLPARLEAPRWIEVKDR